MSTSKRVLLYTLIAIIVLFVVGVLIIKKEAIRVVNAYRMRSDLELIEVDPFHSMEVGAGYDISVIGWPQPDVSVDSSILRFSRIKTSNAVLKVPSVSDSPGEGMLKELKVRVKDIRSIKAGGNSVITLLDLDVDSLIIELSDSQSLRMIDCKIPYLEIKDRSGLNITSIINGE